MSAWVLLEGKGWAPSDVALRSIDTVGKQWTSGLETIKGVKTGCEMAVSPWVDRSVFYGGHRFISHKTWIGW